MVFTSIHPSLKPLLFSTQGPNLSKPWLNPLNPFQLPVHPSSSNHQSKIWVFILTLRFLSTNRFPKHARHLTFTFAHSVTFDLPSPLMLAGQLVAAAIVGSRLDYCNSLLAGTSVRIWLACSLFKTHLLGSLPRNLAFATLRLFLLISTGFLFVTE